MKTKVVDIKMVAVGIGLTAMSAFANLVENPGLEDAPVDGKSPGWDMRSPAYSVVAGEGRNGTKAIRWDGAVEGGKSFPAQRIKVSPGRKYRYEAYVRSVGLKSGNRGATITFEWFDKDGKWIYGDFPGGARGTSDGWQKIECVCSPLPENAAYAQICPYVFEGKSGTAYFDDFKVEEVVFKPVAALLCDRYRDLAWDGDVGFSAGLCLRPLGLDPADYTGTFIATGADSRRRTWPAQTLEADRATVRIPVGELALGEQKVEFVLAKKGGERVGAAETRFVRTASDPGRRVSLDACGRLVVDGRRFFPLGFYNGGLSQGQMRQYFKDSPFNCIMPYSMPKRADLDVAHECGKMSMISIKDYHFGTAHCPDRIRRQDDEEDAVREVVAEFKDHPALLAWYVNDELDVGKAPRMRRRQELMEKLDPDHPTWGCIYQVNDALGYVGTCDVIGSDPYPIPGDIAAAFGTTEKTRRGLLDARPVWQVPQAFDWSAYHKPPREGERAPTEDEMRNMTWQCIAGGANGIVYYAFHTIMMMDKKDPFKRRWAECCRVAEEVRSRFPMLLADPSPVTAVTDAGALKCRLWQHEGATWALVVNCTRNPVRADVRLSAAFSDARQSFGAGFGTLDKDTLKMDMKPIAVSLVRLNP